MYKVLKQDLIHKNSKWWYFDLKVYDDEYYVEISNPWKAYAIYTDTGKVEIRKEPGVYKDMPKYVYTKALEMLATKHINRKVKLR